MTSAESPFFDIPRAEWTASNRSAFAVWDVYPVNPGHALVVSRRQMSDWWEATTEERTDLWLLSMRCEPTSKRHKPDGFNVGFNAGTGRRPNNRPPARPRHPVIFRRRTRPSRGRTEHDPRSG
jgi:diadenosine tetraphosphate (Ap4A) HIT family hydrolase